MQKQTPDSLAQQILKQMFIFAHVQVLLFYKGALMLVRLVFHFGMSLCTTDSNTAHFG